MPKLTFGRFDVTTLPEAIEMILAHRNRNESFFINHAYRRSTSVLGGLWAIGQKWQRDGRRTESERETTELRTILFLIPQKTSRICGA